MRPNILWIFSDQHRAQALSCYGDKNIETPNLDRLADEGIRFTNAYSNCPLCSPYRASLYTGMYCHNHGVRSLDIHLPWTEYSLPEYLQKNGYHTSHVGKWHLAGGAAPDPYVSEYYRPGWDKWLGWENMNAPFDTYYTKAEERNKRYKMEQYQTDGITDFTIKWLEEYEGDKPWFHVMSIEAPHPPNQAPSEFMDMFKDKELKLRPNFKKEHPDSEKWIDKLRAYYAQIKNLDYNVGRVMEVLEEIGQLDNTIIFYFSDHGDFMGSHGKINDKKHMEEESANIPLLIRYPEKIKAGSVSDSLIKNVDFMPTLLGLLGLKIPDICDGRDLSPVLFNPELKVNDTLLIQYFSTFYSDQPTENAYRGLITEEWVYGYYYMTGKEIMYNRINDPYQLENLSDRKEYNTVRKSLYKSLINKMKEEGDTDIFKYFIG